MSDIYKLMAEELRPVFEKLSSDLCEFIHKNIKPRPPIRVWERREDALSLAELRCTSRHGPASLKSRAPVKHMT